MAKTKIGRLTQIYRAEKTKKNYNLNVKNVDMKIKLL